MSHGCRGLLGVSDEAARVLGSCRVGPAVCWDLGSGLGVFCLMQSSYLCKVSTQVNINR